MLAEEARGRARHGWSMEKQLRAPGRLCLLRFEAGIEATELVLAKDKPTWPHIPASLYGDSVFLLCVSALAA